MLGRGWEGLADTPLDPSLPYQAPIGAPVSLPLVPLLMISSLLISLTPSCSILYSRPVKGAQNWLQTLDKLGFVVCCHVIAIAGPEGVGKVGEGCEPVDEVVGHVEKLELVGSGGECGAHARLHARV